VRIIVLVPSEREENTDSFDVMKLRAKLRRTNAPTTRLFLEGGIIMARNIPKRASLRALTTLSGRRFPAITPIAVPTDQEGRAMANAPYI